MRGKERVRGGAGVVAGSERVNQACGNVWHASGDVPPGGNPAPVNRKQAPPLEPTRVFDVRWVTWSRCGPEGRVGEGTGGGA